MIIKDSLLEVPGVAALFIPPVFENKKRIKVIGFKNFLKIIR